VKRKPLDFRRLSSVPSKVRKVLVHRTFEELGVMIEGVAYGHFSGEAEFDRAGQVVVIQLERSSLQGEPLTLDIEKLVMERIALRRKYGNWFFENGGSDVPGHVRKYELFMALAENIEKVFADDVREYLADDDETARFDAA
jgi:hypothetical protein